MKILLVTSFFPPTHTSGTEKRTLGYALKLHERGHDVQVVCAGTFAEGDHYWNGYSDEIYRQIPVRRIAHCQIRPRYVSPYRLAAIVDDSC